jgi:hypothetical protein
MKERGRFLSRALATSAACLLLAACGSSNPTPIIVVVTPTPTAEATASPEVTPEATATPEITSTPTAEVTPTPTEVPTDTPTPAPTSPAAFCSGNASNQAFFVQAAHGIKATIYCATKLPSGWNIASGSWQGTKSGGWMDVTYKYKNTSQTFEIKEGAFCLTDPMTCQGGALVLVQANIKFDGMTTNLTGISPTFFIAINPAKYNAYFMYTHNIPQATAVTFAANMQAVPG